ncbi:hypothetical protein [Streptococcus pneumoniae]|uniref:hypothetical protein n=1 Tax=Streptococcus pneumoniae TaxID=1313 RepID=UPI0011561A5A|nr:hypothetical protein [Streptococcus pneumoniae]
MKIKEQARKLAVVVSKHSFEVADRDYFEVCQMKLTKSVQNTVLRLWMKLAWFEEIFKEYYSYCQAPKLPT